MTSKSDPLFDVTLILTSDLTILGFPLIAGKSGGQVILLKKSLGPGNTSILRALCSRTEEGDMQMLREGCSTGPQRLLTQHAPLPTGPISKEGGKGGEGGPKVYIKATQN